MRDRRMRAMLGMLALALICLFLGFSIDSARDGGVRLSESIRVEAVEVVGAPRR